MLYCLQVCENYVSDYYLLKIILRQFRTKETDFQLQIVKADSPSPFPINWMSTQSFSCTGDNAIPRDGMLVWTIDSILSKENSPHNDGSPCPNTHGDSPPDDDVSHIADSHNSNNNDKKLMVLHSMNIFSKNPFAGNKLEILKFMNVDKPQYGYISTLETKNGHFQKVYADTGTTKDQRDVVLCKINAKDKEILDFVSIIIDVKEINC